MPRPSPQPDPAPTERRLLGAGYQGRVYAEPAAGGLEVVKRAGGPVIVRQLRRAMIRREFAAYQRLAGIAGIPRCLGLRDDSALVLEYIEATPLRALAHAHADREAFYAELREIIARMHAAGVAHTDLKRKDNILVDAEGRPWVIDFGACVLCRDDAGALQRRLFRYFCQLDLNAWIKLKYRGRYGELDAADRAQFRPTALEAAARVLRPLWRLLTFRALRKARRRRRAAREAERP